MHDLEFAIQKDNKEKRFKGAIGKEYELIKSACPHFEKLQETIGSAIKGHFEKSVQENITALEIGCGPGYTTAHISLADQRIKITAIDNDSDMIEKAQKSLKDLIENGVLNLECADSLEYLKNLRPESVDCVASGLTLHNFQKKYRSAVLREIFRILKKGGLFVNADMYSYDKEEDQITHRKWKLGQFEIAFKKIGRDDLTKAWSQHQSEDERPDVIMRENEAIIEMEKIGFTDIETIYREHLEATIKALKPLN